MLALARRCERVLALAPALFCASVFVPASAQAQEVKPVYVQPGIPAKPFAFDIYLYQQTAFAVFGLNGSQVGPASTSATVFGGQVPSRTGSAGVMGITSITVINYNTTPTQIFYEVPYFGTGFADASQGTISTSCASPIVQDLVASPTGSVEVPANSTVTIPFPTPLVVNPGGTTAPCFTILGPYPGVPNQIEVTINGFIN